MKSFYVFIFLTFLYVLADCSVNYNVLTLLHRLHISSVHSDILAESEKLTNNSDVTVKILHSNNIEKFSLDYLLSVNQRKCFKDMHYLLKNLNSEWAIKMLDSNGKLPSGVLLGNLLWIGKYEECSNVKVPDTENGTSGFQGLYCMAQWNISLPSKIHLPMHEVPIKIGICLPNSCQSIDVKADVSHLIDFLYILPVLKNYKGDLKLTNLDCISKDPHLSLSSILFLSFLGFYLLLHILGSSLTAIEYFSKDVKVTESFVKFPSNIMPDCEFVTNEESNGEREECEDDQVNFIENNNHGIPPGAKRDNSNMAIILLEKARKPLKLFCIFTNAFQVLNTSSSKKQFPCLHGLRFFSMAWVILGHTYVHNVNYIDNYMDLLKGIDNLPFQAVIQGTYSVDTFFLIGGFLLGFLYLEEADKRNGRINWLGLCLHRFLRITPVYMFSIGLATLLFKYLGSGPFWEEAPDVAACKQYWWWNILYINNFLPINLMCLTWTWYLANDMQFFIISSLVLYVLWRWKYVGIGIFSSILIGSWITTWCLSSLYNIPPLFMGITEVKNYTEYQGKLILAWDILYSKPYCRIGPHIIGVLLACLLYCNSNKKIMMNMGVQIIGWCCAIFCSASVIYGLYHVTPNSTLLNAYNTFGRTAFSIGVAWLIFCCLTGYAGFINEFLSYKLWIPLSRLTYCAYLFHPLVMNWYFQSRDVPLFFTHSTMITLYFSFLLMSYGVAFLISILFEAPLINLEKLIFKR